MSSYPLSPVYVITTFGDKSVKEDEKRETEAHVQYVYFVTVQHTQYMHRGSVTGG